MKRAVFSELRPRMMVWDNWYPQKWGQGRVKKVTKTRITVLYPDTKEEQYKELEYDKSHTKYFLMRGRVDR